MATIKFMKVKGTWREVADAARTTIRQDEGTKEPSSKWKKRILLAEHSPIRKLCFNWKWLDLPYWVSVHFVRHKYGIEHFVSTQRTDRTGVVRDANRQDAPVMHECFANAQAVMFISRRRLCGRLAFSTARASGGIGSSSRTPTTVNSTTTACTGSSGRMSAGQGN